MKKRGLSNTKLIGWGVIFSAAMIGIFTDSQVIKNTCIAIVMLLLGLFISLRK